MVANCLHPGVIRSKLARDVNPVASRGVGAGERVLRLAEERCGDDRVPGGIARSRDGSQGQYFVDKRPATVVGQAVDDFFAEELWKRSAEMVGAPM